MMGCHFMADHPQGIVPFKEVYIHSLVRDAERQKMSKTKGNVVDPIEVLEKFGTDAVRFTLASMAAPGTDIAFSESRTESYRAFANKIWNASRFIFMYVDQAQERGVWSLSEFDPETGLEGFKPVTLEDRWILSRSNRVAQQVTEALGGYRFHEAAHVVYHFFWGEFCDWYIELMKPRLASENREDARTAFTNLVLIFEGALRALAPFMPFITEEIWHAMFDGKPPLKSISLARYPTSDPEQLSDEAERDMAILQDLIVAVRNIRAEIKVTPKETLPIEIHCDASIRKLFKENAAAITRLANVGTFTFVDHSLAKEANSRSTARFDVRVIYEQKIDVAAERERLNKEIEKLRAEQERGKKQLANQSFITKAPPKVVEGLWTRQQEVKALLEKATAALSALEGK
jgi:valyl-tRNA synthetase